MSVEEWRPVSGHEGCYSVSSLGRVRRDRGGSRNVKRGRILKPVKDCYLCVQLYRDGKGKKLLVHRIVCEAFHGPCPEGMECRHLDGNPQNNRAGNLRWGTPKENHADMALHGTDSRGERSGSTSLASGQVIAAIVRYMRGGVSQRQIGRDLGIGRSSARCMVTGRTWKVEYQQARKIVAARAESAG